MKNFELKAKRLSKRLSSAVLVINLLTLPLADQTQAVEVTNSDVITTIQTARITVETTATISTKKDPKVQEELDKLSTQITVGCTTFYDNTKFRWRTASHCLQGSQFIAEKIAEDIASGSQKYPHLIEAVKFLPSADNGYQESEFCPHPVGLDFTGLQIKMQVRGFDDVEKKGSVTLDNQSTALFNPSNHAFCLERQEYWPINSDDFAITDDSFVLSSSFKPLRSVEQTVVKKSDFGQYDYMSLGNPYIGPLEQSLLMNYGDSSICYEPTSYYPFSSHLSLALFEGKMESGSSGGPIINRSGAFVGVTATKNSLLDSERQANDSSNPLELSIKSIICSS